MTEEKITTEDFWEIVDKESIAFGRKNFLFILVVMGSHHVDHELLETSQGKIIQWRYKAHAKEDK